MFSARVKHVLNTLQSPLNAPLPSTKMKRLKRMNLVSVRDASVPSVQSQSQMGQDSNWNLLGNPGGLDVLQHT